MPENADQTRRVRFRRRDAPELASMPSAALRDGRLPLAPPRRRRRGLAAAVLALLALALLPVVLAVWLVLDPARLTPLARDQLNRLLGPDLVAGIDEAAFTLSGPGAVSGLVTGVEVRHAVTRDIMASGALVRFSVSPLSLLTGRPQVTALSVAGARVALDGPSGSVGLLGPDGLVDPGRAATLLNHVLSTMSQRLSANPDLDIQIVDARFALAGGRSLVIERLALSPEAGRAGSLISGRILLDDVPATVSGRAGHGAGAPWRLAADGIRLHRDFSRQAGGEPRFCDGTMDVEAASGGQAGALAIDLKVDGLRCAFDRLGTYDMALSARASLDPARGIVDLLDGRLDVNRSYFRFEGAVAPARLTGQPSPADGPAYRYELVVNDARIDPLDNAEGPMPISGKIAGTYTPALARLALDEVVTDTGGGAVVTGAASLLFGEETPALFLAVAAQDIPVANFKRLWPRFAAPLPRAWVRDRLFGGSARDVRLELRLPPGKLGSGTPLEKDHLFGQADLFGVRFDTIGDIPPIRDADATVRFDGMTVDVVLGKGVAYLPSDRSADVERASFRIADLKQRPVRATLDLAVRGDAAAIAELASARPLNALAGTDLTPADFGGRARAEGSVSFPLAARTAAATQSPAPAPAPAAPPAEPVTYDIAITLADFSISRPVDGRTLRNGAGTLEARPGVLRGDLKAEIDGLPARLRFTRPTDGGDGEQTLSATLDDEQRNRLLPALRGVLRGPTPIEVTGARGRSEVSVDLTRARIILDALGWEKGRNIPAKAEMTVERDGETLRVRDLRLTGQSLRARGALRFEGGRFAAADLEGVRLSGDDSFSAKVAMQGGKPVVTLGGERIDARSFLRRLLPGAGQGGEAGADRAGADGVTITGRIGRIVGFNDEILTDAAIRIEGRGIALSGRFDRGGMLQLSRAGGSLAFSTDNAGAALRFGDFYRRMSGGTLTGDLRETGPGRLSGPVSIRGFRVSGEPRLASLVNDKAQGSASLNEAIDTRLDRAEAAFELVQGNLTLSRGAILVDDGIVRGEAVGATVAGTILDREGRMDVSGTFMPARGLNRIVGSIPILGALLGSGTRSGLIGITYRIAGEARNPSVFVNPLSLIAPGVFRQIFE